MIIFLNCNNEYFYNNNGSDQYIWYIRNVKRIGSLLSALLLGSVESFSISQLVYSLLFCFTLTAHRFQMHKATVFSEKDLKIGWWHSLHELVVMQLYLEQVLISFFAPLFTDYVKNLCHFWFLFYFQCECTTREVLDKCIPDWSWASFRGFAPVVQPNQS